jgi:hypothetical protein
MKWSRECARRLEWTTDGSQVWLIDHRLSRVDRLALAVRQLLLGQPGLALGAEQIRRGRAVSHTAHQDGVDLVLGARARPHELRALRQPATRRADALIGRRVAGGGFLGEDPRDRVPR